MVQESEATRNMSDGDNATPGLPSARPNRWLTRSTPPSPGAAPWERNGNSDSGEIDKAEQAGNHTDGVTVADLIAKVHGAASVPEELKRPRPEPEERPEPVEPLPEADEWPHPEPEEIRRPPRREPEAPRTEIIAPVQVDLADPDTE